MGLAYNNPHSSSDTTIMGVDSLLVPQLSSCDKSGGSLPSRLRGSAPHSPGSPMEAGEMLLLVPAVATLTPGVDTVEVHVPQSELDNLQCGGLCVGSVWTCQNCSQRHKKMEGVGIRNIFSIYFVIKDSCQCYIKMWVNKVVVGSGCRDVPTYVGEGVASCGTPGALGGPYHVNCINYGHFWVFSRRCTSDMLHLKCVIPFIDVTSFNDAMTSYVMSRCHMCIGHMTIYYKRATNTSVELVRFNSVTRDPRVAGV